MTESAAEAFERGQHEGITGVRLDHHEERLDKMNGSIDRLTGEVRGVRLDLQHLGDQVTSGAAAALTIAQALKDERVSTAEALKVSTDRSNAKWTPVQLLIGFIGSLAAATTSVYLIVHP